MYQQSARYYDALYASTGKDYAAEARRIAEIIDARKQSPGNALLDVACGTGMHLLAFRDRFDCEGLDVGRRMIEIARQRLPEVPLHERDMIAFNLAHKFDAIVCLFSSIGYVPNVQRLDQALATFERHLVPGGVLVIEPWFSPDAWVDGHLNALFVDEPSLKVARFNVSRRDGISAVMDFHYMVASADGIRSFSEMHRMTLFTPDEYMRAFAKAGLAASDERPGLGRGLYIATKPA